MSERMMMEGKLATLKDEKARLAKRIEGNCLGIREQINPALYEVEDMDVAMAAQQMDDMVLAHAELLAITGKIQRLERELGRGR